jgi:hypothetical protein
MYTTPLSFYSGILGQIATAHTIILAINYKQALTLATGNTSNFTHAIYFQVS